MRRAPVLIAFDMDGTLYDANHTPLPSSLAAIRNAQDAGIQIVLASGRHPWALRHLAQGFGLDPAQLTFIGLNGTLVVDGATGEVIWSSFIESPLLARLLAHVRQFPVTVMTSNGPQLFVEDAAGYNVGNEARLNGQELVVVSGLEEVSPAYKILIAGEPATLARVAPEVSAPFAGELDFPFSAPFYLECLPHGVNKGVALEHLCEVRGIALADAIAFGDNENDIEMLSVAGLGVAMGNALNSVKAVADVVTADHNSHGIARVLEERFGL